MTLVDLDTSGVAAGAAAMGEIALGEGKTALATERYKEAGAILERRIHSQWRQSEKDTARFLAASQYYRGGHYHKAQQLCRQIQVKLLPSELRPIYLQFLRDVKARSADDYVPRTREALIHHFQRKEYQKLLEVLQEHPYVIEPDAMAFLRAVCCEHLGEYRAAAIFYGDALSGGESRPEAVFTAASFPLTMSHEGRLEEAWSYVEHQLAKIHHPVICITASLLRYHQVAVAKTDKEREFLTREQIRYFEEAWSLYHKLPSDHQRNSDLRDYMTLCLEAAAFSLFSIGEKTRSSEVCDLAISFNPNSYAPRTVRGMLSYPKDQAVADFQEAVQLGDQTYTPYYLLAHAALTRRRFDEAEAWSRETLKRDPSHEVIAQLNEWLAITRKLQGADAATVQQLFQKALELAPDNPRIRSNYALHLESLTSPSEQLVFDWDPWKIVELPRPSDPDRWKQGPRRIEEEAWQHVRSREKSISDHRNATASLPRELAMAGS